MTEATPNQPPVLVYQMGKVASTTIYKSLKAVDGLDVHHLHRMNAELIAKRSAAGRKQSQGLARKDRLGLRLHRELVETGSPFSIVTMVREPIARNISGYFQNIESHFDISMIDTISTEDLTERFINRYGHHIPLEWFDREIKATTGIDVYEKIFPKMKGHTTIDGAKGRRVLIMRHDLPDDEKVTVISRFLGRNEPIRLTSHNVSDDKPYATAYRRFLNDAQLPSDYVSRMLGSRYATHFWSKDQLDQIRRRWTGGAN